MRWLVDGMNVVGSRPDGWWRDRRGAMRKLVERLEDFAEETGDEVAVVFDGRPFELEPGGRVDVGFAPGGRNAADDAIADRVAEDPDSRSLTVVTSDGELVNRVRAHGAEVVPSGGFRRRLDG
jgi:predicted RNA-binding protein with PIN domain